MEIIKNIILILLIYFKNCTCSHLVYPFKRSTKEKKSYPEDLLQNDLEITIEIGTPPQKVDINLRSKVYAFFIASSEIGLPYPTYNEQNSLSLIKLSKLTKFNRQEFQEGYKIYENLRINQQEIKLISLVLSTKLAYKEAGALGLRLLKSHEFGGNLSFIYQIKRPANLDNYAFTLRYDNDDNGELIIGSYPHLYDSKYNEKNFFISRARNIGSSIDWVLDFDAIKYDNVTIKGIITKSLIQIEFGLLLAPSSVKKFFQEKFFLNRCREEFYSKRNITIIHCDKSLDITKFKNLSFVLKDIDYQFILTYKELFIEKENEYIFGIVFDNTTYNINPYWILGKPFMKKYQLIYDLDKKIIGLYKKKSNEEKKFNINIVYISILLVLFIIASTLISHLLYIFKKKRKNKAFELEDENFDYTPTNFAD